MSSSGLSRRALLGLGLSRVREQLDAGDRPSGGGAAPARHRPTLADAQARWDAAGAADSDVWARVDGELRALARRLASGDAPDPVVSVFGPQSTPATRGAIDALFDRATSGTIVAFSVWSTGVMAQLFKVAADLDPLPPGMPGVWRWGSRERLRQDLDHHADDIHYRRRELAISAPTATAVAERLAAAVPALGAAYARRGDQALARFAAVVESYAERDEEEAGAGRPVSVAVTYLLVAARRR